MSRKIYLRAACLLTLATAGCGGGPTKDADQQVFSDRMDNGALVAAAPVGTPEALVAGVTVAPETPTTDSGTGALPLGEYGCIGSGTTQLAGMGSKLLPGGRYTDLDDGSPGTYKIVGSTIVFTGGHLDGETGRDIKNNGYTIGKMVSCQKW